MNHIKTTSKRPMMCAVIIFFLSVFITAVQAVTLPPPDYQMIDSNQVNLATGQVSPSLTDLSIGGERGLTHSISADASEFVNAKQVSWGPRDSYSGGLRSGRVTFNSPSQLRGADDLTLPTVESFRGLTSFLGNSSAVFYINGDGTYTAEKDSRHTLEYDTSLSRFVHTHPDGQVVYFSQSSPISASTNKKYLSLRIDKVVYANGFTVYFDAYLKGSGVGSVRTNTGYQLKYIYDTQWRDLPQHLKDKLKAIKAQRNDTFDVHPNHSTWIAQTPKKVIGLNNQYEVCPLGTADCSLAQEWPTATYYWPDGMPGAMYLEESDFKVVDAEGRVTIYTHTPFDRSTGASGDLPKGLFFTTRLTSVKQANETSPSREYSYENTFSVRHDEIGGFRHWATTGVGVLEAVKLGTLANYYSQFRPTDLAYARGHGSVNRGSAFRSIRYVKRTGYHDRMYEVDFWDKTISLEKEQANRVSSVRNKANGVTTRYQYSDRVDGSHNITEITAYANSAGKIVGTASYPSTCINRKTCNQAEWLRDAHGNQTDYSYHSESGQVATITLPAPKPGMARPQTRYYYEKRFAYFKNDSGVIQKADDGIWLLVEESQCISGAPVAGSPDIRGCAAGEVDEVRTTYEYDDASAGSNLHLQGLAVRAVNAQGRMEERRTCYAYNNYGQRIGETQPKADLSVCP